MTFLKTSKDKILVEPTKPLYKWSKVYGGMQKKFFTEKIAYRREIQIESFIKLNDFKSVVFLTDTDILQNAKKTYSNKPNTDLLVITDQKFGRNPCPIIIQKLKTYVEQFKSVYLCINSCYVNIDNSFIDDSLSDDFFLAISQWLRKSLNEYLVLDLGIDVLEDGQSFTWVIPNRHFFIQKK